MARIVRSRIAFFLAGSVAGVYGAAKARRAAYRLSTPGLVDQAAALGLGWRAFSTEVREGMETRERDIARRLIGPPYDHGTLSLRAPSDSTPPDTLPDKDHD